MKPRSSTPNGWRSIANYANNIAEAGAGHFTTSLYGATTDPIRNLLSGTHRRLAREIQSPDVVHLTHQTIAPYVHATRRTPSVVTLHDFIPVMFRARTIGLDRLWAYTFKRSGRALRDLPLVFANSDCTARDASRELGLDPARIITIPVSVARVFYSGASGVSPMAGLPDRPFVLSLGTRFYNKNLPLLIEALGRPELAGVPLVRVGGALSEAQLALAERAGVRDRLFELGELPLEDLLSAMASAAVLAQPSVYEGFGMPVAEAMAFGLPVVCSDGGALPEVAVDAARVVPIRQKRYGPPEPEDVRDFAAALASVIHDPAELARLRAAGFANARRFHPDTVGPQLLAGYNEVIRRWG
ncbi:MAG: glycosyltransferase family 1 protein [bacterium]